MKLFKASPESRLKPAKLELIDYAFSELGITSFADLGGVWGVEGGYTFYGLEKYQPAAATLVDTHPTEIVLQKSRDFPQLRMVEGNFGDREVAAQVGRVDAVLFYDVLLHQVNPNWDEVLEIYAPLVEHFVIYNQQWIGSKGTVRLMELGEKQYFANVPHSRREEPYKSLFGQLDDIHPEHDRLWRDVHNVWQWGITDADMVAKLASLGFQNSYRKECGQFGKLKNFVNYAYVFSR